MLRQSDLKGFKTKEMTHRIMVTMFADDTTVYLTESDDFEALETLLQCWCKASGARFNVLKTEVIPIGSKDYRDQVIESRKIHLDKPPLPDHIEIATKGKAVRILGACVGNSVCEEAIWSPIIKKIENSPERWEIWHQSINRRAIIIQQTFGGMTQYLTTAQGMPKHIETTLSKQIREFIWDTGGKNSISIDTLCAPASLRLVNHALHGPTSPMH
ncbi:hypothetical protein BDR05DRAFT_978342 [Suillus weaverae]|nr:hypothetical protein BDR05DRAFT_978342 [Suillus weaverae]